MTSPWVTYYFTSLTLTLLWPEPTLSKYHTDLQNSSMEWWEQKKVQVSRSMVMNWRNKAPFWDCMYYYSRLLLNSQKQHLSSFTFCCLSTLVNVHNLWSLIVTLFVWSAPSWWPYHLSTHYMYAYVPKSVVMCDLDPCAILQTPKSPGKIHFVNFLSPSFAYV